MCMDAEFIRHVDGQIFALLLRYAGEADERGGDEDERDERAGAELPDEDRQLPTTIRRADGVPDPEPRRGAVGIRGFVAFI